LWLNATGCHRPPPLCRPALRDRRQHAAARWFPLWSSAV